MFRGKPKSKSYLSQLLDSVDHPPLPVYILLIIFSLILDLLQVIGRILCSLLVIVLASSLVLGSIAYVKVKPKYDEYMKEAKEVVDNSTEDTFRFNETTVIYDKSGKVISSLSEDRDAVYLDYDEIPQNVINAFVAIEDRTFWTNSGIDIKGIGRVCLDAVKTKGKEVHGASTITQQLARNIFLSSDVNLDRKLKEMAISLELTKKYTKEQIMEFYVNNIYFANGYYGVEAAAEGYFGKQAKDLTLSETCYLCAIPNSPTYYDPRENPERAKKRRDLILDAMQDIGYISQKDVEDAKAEENTLCKAAGMTGGNDTTYAIDCAVRWFMKLDGFSFQYHFDADKDYEAYQIKYEKEYETMRNELCRGGYRIYTSLDSSTQKSLQKIADEYVSEKRKALGLDDFETAIVLSDPKGRVEAIIGGAGGSNFGFNRGYQAYRQPGSSVKPLVVYTPALEEGYLPETPIKNVSVKEAQKALKEAAVHGAIADISQCSGKTVTMRYGLEKSLNGVAYSIMNDLSPQKTVPYLEQMKFTKIVPGDYTLSASLGGLTNGVLPVEMTGAFACLANDGEFNEPTCLVSVIDRYGKERYKKPEETFVYSEESAEAMQNMMLGVAKTGTAARLQWDASSKIPLYCKTGTTDDQKDNWMCGWAGDHVMSVWIGCDTPKDISTVGAAGAGVLYKECMLDVLKKDLGAEKKEQERDKEKQEERQQREKEEEEAVAIEEEEAARESADSEEIWQEDSTVQNASGDELLTQDTQSAAGGMSTENTQAENTMPAGSTDASQGQADTFSQEQVTQESAAPAVPPE